MLKRTFDLTVALFLLLITAPLFLVIAIAITLDSAGPILYGSPRIGSGGRVFDMWRFRTVDLQQPDYLPVSARLTRVGRFIRNLSLDDLPNLLNIVTGDMSLVGPRPTEPERVDLDDPAWQRILSVRPGNSPAILQLGKAYNRSPNQLKQQLELAYVERHSFWYDLQLCWRFLWAAVASRGNVKARGTAKATLAHAIAEVPSTPAALPSLRWQLADRQGDDWQASISFLRQEQPGWTTNEPHCLLIPVGGEIKPALALSIDPETWTVPAFRQLHSTTWVAVESSRYVALGLTLIFASGASQRIVATVFDVAAPQINEWFARWQQLETPLPLFVLADEAEAAVHSHALPSDNYPVQPLQATIQRLQNLQVAAGNFAEEKALLRQILLSSIL